MMEALSNEIRAGLDKKGFTLIEILVVIVIMGVLFTLAIPSFVNWRRELHYRETARDITSFLRNAKNQAITVNRQQRVEFDIPNRRYGIRPLDMANMRANNTDWAAIAPVAVWSDIPPDVLLSGPGTNNIDGTFHVMVFNTNGSMEPTAAVEGVSTILIGDATIPNRFEVAVTPSGRIRSRRVQ